MTRSEYRAVLSWFGAIAEGGGRLGAVHAPPPKPKPHPKSITLRKSAIALEPPWLTDDERSHAEMLHDMLAAAFPESVTRCRNCGRAVCDHDASLREALLEVCDADS
jgi:hypothetical protein